MIGQLLTPVLEQQQADAEVVMAQKKDMEKQEERLKALELVVFKDESLATLIDDMRFRIEQGEVNVRKEIAEVRDFVINKYEDTKQQLFQVDGRISANEVLKEQFEVFFAKQQNFDKNWISYKEEVKEQFHKTKDQFSQEYKKLLDDIHHLKSDVLSYTPKLDKLGLEVSKLQDAMAKEDARFEFMQRSVISLNDKKVELEFFRESQDEMKNIVGELSKKLDSNVNEMRTLQNWIEKYEPLKVQHQITDTLASCLNRKAKQKLGEYDIHVCETLREQILSDFGNPAIQDRVFALIEKLERDSREMMGVTSPFVATDYFQQSPKKNQMQASQQESFRGS